MQNLRQTCKRVFTSDTWGTAINRATQASKEAEALVYENELKDLLKPIVEICNESSINDLGLDFLEDYEEEVREGNSVGFLPICKEKDYSISVFVIPPGNTNNI